MDRFAFNSSVVCRFKQFLVKPLLDVRVGISTAGTIFFTLVLRSSLDGVLIMLSTDCVADILLSGELTMIFGQVAAGDPGQGGVVEWRRLNSYLCGRSNIAKIMSKTKGWVAKVERSLVRSFAYCKGCLDTRGQQFITLMKIVAHLLFCAP